MALADRTFYQEGATGEPVRVPVADGTFNASTGTIATAAAPPPQTKISLVATVAARTFTLVSGAVSGFVSGRRYILSAAAHMTTGAPGGMKIQIRESSTTGNDGTLLAELKLNTTQLINAAVVRMFLSAGGDISVWAVDDGGTPGETWTINQFYLTLQTL